MEDDFSRDFDNYYELLGVDSKAGPEEIRRAYRDRLKTWHPDKNPDRLKEAEDITKALNAAYHILSDPYRRSNYDRMLRYNGGKDPGNYGSGEAYYGKTGNASFGLTQIFLNVRDLYCLFMDAVRGRYSLRPLNLAIIAGGLLYLIIPTDLIPDFIPFVGLLDDVAVLTIVVNLLRGELAAYRNWKKNTRSA